MDTNKNYKRRGSEELEKILISPNLWNSAFKIDEILQG